MCWEGGGQVRATYLAHPLDTLLVHTSWALEMAGEEEERQENRFRDR